MTDANAMTISFRMPVPPPRKAASGRSPTGPEPQGPDADPGRTRVPRVARLMALAIHFDGLLRQGVVADRATLARLGRVSRARVTQILDLLDLAPDIQEAVLDLRTDGGRAPLILADLRPIARVPYWGRQRRLWAALRTSK